MRDGRVRVEDHHRLLVQQHQDLGHPPSDETPVLGHYRAAVDVLMPIKDTDEVGKTNK